MRNISISELRASHKRNISQFQEWMREHLVRETIAAISPVTFQTEITFLGDGDMIDTESEEIVQVAYNATYDKEEVRRLSPSESMREIIRFYLSFDDMIATAAHDIGISVSIPEAGPVSISSEAAKLTVPKEFLH